MEGSEAFIWRGVRLSYGGVCIWRGLTFFHLFFHVSLSSHPGISFLLSYAHTVVRPLVCTCTTYFKPRFQVAQVFAMRWVFIGCPCALGSLSSQPHTHTPLSHYPVLSSFHVFIFLSALRAHVHIRLNLNFSACVCVCTSWNHRDPFRLFVLNILES